MVQAFDHEKCRLSYPKLDLLDASKKGQVSVTDHGSQHDVFWQEIQYVKAAKACQQITEYSSKEPGM